jgi:hypothetical protein
MTESLAQPTFRTLKQTALKGRPSCATAPANHATRSTDGDRHTSGLWLPFRDHYMENLGDNANPNVLLRSRAKHVHRCSVRENWSSESRTLRSRDPGLTTPLTGSLHLMLRSGAADHKILTSARPSLFPARITIEGWCRSL